MARALRIPGYRRHSSGQARVTLNGTDFLLGPFGSAESKEVYARKIAEFLTGTIKVNPVPVLTVTELILRYWKFACAYYGFKDKGNRGDYYCLKVQGQDLHKLVAARMLGIPLEQVTKKQRQLAKPINFGKPGAMGLTTLRQYAMAAYGLDLSEDQVASLSDAWLDSFPEMDATQAESLFQASMLVTGCHRPNYGRWRRRRAQATP